MPLPGFLHTSPAHVPTFEALLAELYPGPAALHVVDETLLADAREHGPEVVAERVAAHLVGLRGRGAGIVCCTCSTIGDVAERVAPDLPVFRVDRPMAARAVAAGRRIAVVTAVESTLLPTRDLLEQEARAAGRDVDVRLVVSDGAWERFEAGDQDGYLARIADTARRMAVPADVVVLAQASMAGAEPLLEDLPVPVLSSPRLAVEHLPPRTTSESARSGRRSPF